jgi:hypothetical protein
MDYLAFTFGDIAETELKKNFPILDPVRPSLFA